jgi:hypothetical protein
VTQLAALKAKCAQRSPEAATLTQGVSFPAVTTFCADAFCWPRAFLRFVRSDEQARSPHTSASLFLSLVTQLSGSYALLLIPALAKRSHSLKGRSPCESSLMSISSGTLTSAKMRKNQLSGWHRKSPLSTITKLFWLCVPLLSKFDAEKVM